MTAQQNAKSDGRVSSISMGCLTLLAVLLLASETSGSDDAERVRLLTNTHTPRRETRMDRIVLGTVLDLSSAKKLQATHDVLSGYRLWVEQTNRHGGILVGDVRIEVSLEVRDCEGSEALQEAMYRQLVDDGVDFLLGGGENSTRSMIAAARAHNTISMTSRGDPSPWNAVENPATFAVFPSSQLNAAAKFVKTVRNVWSLVRLAVVGIGSIDGPSGRECREMLGEVNRSRVDVQLVHQSWVDLADPQSLLDAMSRVRDVEADVLVACTADEKEAGAIAQAAGQVILRGWNIHNQLEQCVTRTQQLCTSKQSVTPQVVESVSLKFMFFTAGASGIAFTDNADGWAEKVASPVLWHPDLEHSDPFFGSAKELNALWRSRVDFGNGRSMSEHAAVAVASGLVLKLAIEAAGSIEPADVAGAMHSLDVDTFLGRIRMGGPDGPASGNVNTGLEQPIVQWDCSSASQCERVLRVPATTSRGSILPYRQACPVNSLWNSTDDLIRPSEPTGSLRADHGRSRAGKNLDPSCVPCLQGDMAQLSPMLTDQSNMQSLRAACPDTFHPIHIGIASMAGPGDGEVQKGVQAAIKAVSSTPGLAWLMALVAVKTVPLRLPAPTSTAPASAAPPEPRPGSEAAAARPGAPAWDASAGREAFAAVRAGVAEARDRGVLLWNEGAARALGVEEEGARSACEGGGMQVAWGQVALCVTPAARLQGRALAELVEHFHWRRLHLVVDSDPASQQMRFEFEQVAGQLGLQTEELVLIPDAADAAGQEEALDRIAALDDCRSVVVVLLVTRRSAVAVFDRVLPARGREAAWAGDRRFVVVGSEAATRAANAPQGMLGLRTVAMHESVHAAIIMGEQGAAGPGGWGTGVSAAEEEEEAAWQDVAVEDRLLFAADAVGVMILAIVRSQFLGRRATAEEMEEAVLALNSQVPVHEGATGPFKFQAKEGAAGQRILERVAGRYSFVNKRREGWSAIATLDVDRHVGEAGVAQAAIVHTVSRTLGQRDWQETALDWGVGAKAGGGKPDDTCECVVWSKMGPYSRLASCRWSAAAVSVVVGAAAAVVGLAGAVWWSRRERVEEAEKVVRQRIQELRTRLKLNTKDGFVLSTERRGLRRLVWGGAVQEIEIQPKQLEALARMLLWKSFDLHALDSLAWLLQSHAHGPAERLRAPSEPGSTTRTLAGFVHMDEEAGARTPPHPSPVRWLRPGARTQTEMSPQHQELRAVILEASRRLLDPRLDADSERLAQPEESPRRGAPFPFPFPLPFAESRSSFDAGMLSLPRGLSGADHPGMAAARDAPEAPESAPLPAGRSLQLQAAEGAGSSKPRERKSRRIKLAEQEISGVERRFHFFATRVAKVRVWLEDDGSLFQELKNDVVQGFMDTIHSDCDRVFESMLANEGGKWLARFPHAAAPTRLCDGLGTTGSHRPRVLRAGTLRIRADLGPCHPDFRSQSVVAASSSRAGLAALPVPLPEARDASSLDIDALLLAPPLARKVPAAASPASGLDARMRFRMDLSMPSLDFPLHRTSSASSAQSDFDFDFGRARSRTSESPPAHDRTPPPAPAPAQLEPSRDSEEHRGLGSRADGAEEEAVAEKVLRQDDPRVRAIRLSEEDWKEIELENSAAALTLFPAWGQLVGHEEVYISQLHRRAELLNEGFQQCVRHAIEEKFWGRMHVESAPVKTVSRMREKIISYASHGAQAEGAQLPLAANILDPIRCTVICNGPDEMLEAAWWLLEEGAAVGLPVARVKNKFAVRDASEYDGYRDIMMCVVYTGLQGLRIIAEIQFHDTRLHKLKRMMHKLYKVKRATRVTNIL